MGPKHRNRRRAGAPLAAILFLIGAASAQAGEIAIGALLPISGKGAGYGQEQRMALQIALEEVNAAGGILGQPVRLVIHDTAGDNAQAIALTRRLLGRDQVLAILGPYFSEEAEVAFPLANEQKTVILSASSAKPGVAARHRPYAFRNALLIQKAYPVGVKRWVAQYGIKTAAVIHDGKDAYARAGAAIMGKALEELGVKVLDTVTFQTGDSSFAAQVTRVRAANPDGVVLEGVELELANIVRELRKQGMAKPVMGGLGLAGPRVLEMAGPANMEGAFTVTGYFWEGTDPKVQGFVKRFRELSGRIPHFTTAQMYDAFLMVVAAIERARPANRPETLADDREKIRRQLEGLRDFPGITGRTSVNPDGDVDKQVFVITVRDGRWAAIP